MSDCATKMQLDILLVDWIMRNISYSRWWRIAKKAFTDLKDQCDSFSLGIRGRQSGNTPESQFFEMAEHSALSGKGVEMLWLTSQMCPPAPPWNTKRTAELKEARMWREMRKASAYLLLAEWLCTALLSLSLTLLALLSLLKRNTCSVGASKYEIQFSSPKRCFY